MDHLADIKSMIPSSVMFMNRDKLSRTGVKFAGVDRTSNTFVTFSVDTVRFIITVQVVDNLTKRVELYSSPYPHGAPWDTSSYPHADSWFFKVAKKLYSIMEEDKELIDTLYYVTTIDHLSSSVVFGSATLTSLCAIMTSSSSPIPPSSVES